MRGEIAKDGNVLFIQRIHVHYRLRVPDEAKATAERVRQLHADHCPVARTLKGCVAIETEIEFG